MMQILSKYKELIDFILSFSSKMRHVYDLGILGIRIIINEGFGSFLFKLKEKIHGNEPDAKSKYDLWMLKNDPTATKLQEYKKDINNFKYKPKISIITTISTSDFARIESAIESVMNQIYENWELCIMDSGTKDDGKKKLTDYANKDSRIKVEFVPINKGFTINTNENLAKASGEFIGFLDQSGELAESALFEVIKQLNTDPYTDFVYFDEDEISVVEKKRVNPHFKPDWSPDTLRSYNYIGNFIILRRALIEEVGYLREGFEDSELYDLILRTTEKAKTIIHIPKILYHQIKQASDFASIPFFSKNAREIRETILSSTCSQIIFQNEINTQNIKLSVIILNKNAPELIIPLLDCLIKYNKNNYYEIIIGDTGTTEQRVLEYYQQVSDKIIIVKGLKYHFSSNYNYLISKYARGEIVGIINNDIILEDTSFLHKIENVLLDKKIGAVGTKLMYIDGRLQHGGIFFFENGQYKGLPYHRLHRRNPDELPEKELENVPAVTGAFMFCRRDEFISVCGFDENYEEEAQDIDLCLKLNRSGKKIAFLNVNKIIHIENATRKKGSENWKDRNYFLWKWYSFLECTILDSELNNDIWSNKI